MCIQRNRLIPFLILVIGGLTTHGLWVIKIVHGLEGKTTLLFFYRQKLGQSGIYIFFLEMKMFNFNWAFSVSINLISVQDEQDTPTDNHRGAGLRNSSAVQKGHDSSTSATVCNIFLSVLIKLFNVEDMPTDKYRRANPAL